jgi:ribonuclease P protein component
VTGQSFTKRGRLCAQADIDRLLKKGKTFSEGALKIKIAGNKMSYNRLAIRIPARAMKKSHERNALRRRIKEIYRGSTSSFKKGYDILVSVRKSDKIPKDYKTVEDLLFTLLTKCGILNETDSD